MGVLLLILQVSLMLVGIGVVALLNIFVWGGIIAVFKRGNKDGNDKNVHKH